MSKMIQIRNVPDDLHRTLKARAAKSGMTLSDYLRSEIEEVAGQPTLSEWLAQLAKEEPLDGASVELDPSPEEIIRAHRDA